MISQECEHCVITNFVVGLIACDNDREISLRSEPNRSHPHSIAAGVRKSWATGPRLIVKDDPAHRISWFTFGGRNRRVQLRKSFWFNEFGCRRGKILVSEFCPIFDRTMDKSGGSNRDRIIR